MNKPSISIIMPVYNMEPFLKDSIESILKQDFGDFEFIIINDGSTDGSEEIINSFSDKRIRYFTNSRNMGLVFTLNKGIEESSAEWIARMDGDDIALPEKLSKQVAFVKKYPDTDLLCTRISLIDEKNNPIGEWKDDARAISEKEIRAYLIKNNCIAHPTVLVKTNILRHYKYNIQQSESEDYDLWLRMASDGIRIRKINETLLLHRIVTNSFTRNRQKNIFLKLFRVKKNFVLGQFKKRKFNVFILKILLTTVMDLIKGIIKFIYRR